MSTLREQALEAWHKRQAAQEAAQAERDAQSKADEERYCRELCMRHFSREPDAMEHTPDGYGVIVLGALRLARTDRSAFELLDKCPKCGEEVRGQRSIYDLANLGHAIEDWEPTPYHKCPKPEQPAVEVATPETDAAKMLRLLNEMHELLHGND